jgi:hypothetical protein
MSSPTICGHLHAATVEPPLLKLEAQFLLQIVELVPADVDAMSSAQVSRLCAALLPDSWLTAPQEVSTLPTPALHKPCVARCYIRMGCGSGAIEFNRDSPAE